MNLLYPNGKDHVYIIEKDTYQNLALDELVDMIALTNQEKELVRDVFIQIPNDADTILYRQEIVKDLMKDEAFCKSLGEILQKLELLKEYNSHNGFQKEEKGSIWDLIDYMQEMDIYVQVVEELNYLFQHSTISSRGLREIADILQNVINMNQIGELKEIVEHLKTEIGTLKSVKIGLNLAPDLRPEEIVILDYGMEAFPSQVKKQSLKKRIMNLGNSYQEPDTMMKHICANVEEHLSKAVQQYKKELKEYVSFDGYFLLDICNDLKFLLMMTRLGRRLQEDGYGLTYPILKNQNTVEIKGVYNIRLINRQVDKLVKNDFVFNEKERVFILTGPNRGGKTMLTQAVGIAAFMASQGLFVAADFYEGFIFDNLLTHFPADENNSLDLGRLGEEAVRIQKIARKATSKSLVLLNETYSSTSAVDGLYLARDLVHVLKHNEVPTIFNTHLHELARQTFEMNKWEGNANIISLTMEIVDNQNTFRVLRREPDSSSFAHNIALKYGVTYEQMLELM